MSFPPDAKSESPALHIEEKEITGSARYVTWLFRKNAKQTESYEINLIVELFLQLHSFIYFVTWTGKRQIAKQSKWKFINAIFIFDVFLIAYISFEVPSNYCLKRFSPSRWIAFLMFSWGALTISLGGVHSYGALTAVRFLLGTFEAGLFPGLVYFFTFWYRPEERSLRVALVLASSTLAGAFGGAIAYGVGFMNMTAGLEAWRWLFILEGIPSVLSSILVWFFFPDFPETAKWLSAHERDRVVRRLEGIASTHHSRVTWAEAKQTLLGWRVWAHAVAYITISVPFSSLSLFSPTIVAGLGYEGLDAQLFTVPPYACAYFVTLTLSWLADTKNQRSLVSASSMAVGAFAFLAQALLPEKAFKARFAFLCLAASGSFGSIPPLLGWLSTNIRGAGAVGLAIAINISTGGTGQIIGVWIYKANEKPGYITGNLPCFD
ncbi:major facilitator superfamily transporter [Rhizoctonia solani]|uniref:Major facilitator superfamily transporter n=1 Tax=Rhizoctonia solani TaxID=456999 RepID=A0A8H8NWB1_9AGAM|nr:major facilitator superfamily transporter [Rhizoctonia solani]QRW21109.1 major facilitator superfamily transporter [Rhizoctonia solani]